MFSNGKENKNVSDSGDVSSSLLNLRDAPCSLPESEPG